MQKINIEIIEKVALAIAIKAWERCGGEVEDFLAEARLDAQAALEAINYQTMRGALERISQFTIPAINALSAEAQIARDALK